MAYADLDQRATGNQQPPLGELVKGLSEDLSTLISQHLALAKAELAEKAREAGAGAGMFGGAGLVGLMALGAFIAALIAGMAAFVPVWAAALIVSAVLGAIAGSLFLMGKSKISQAAPPVPRQAVESARETTDEVQWKWAQGRS